MTRIAVLDDYLRCAAAAAAADWASFGAEIDFFYDTLHQIDALVARLAPYDVLVTMRERTRFPRAVLEKLPNLKLIAATGRRQANVDCEAATELGIMGLGRIGTVVAGYGRAFGMAVVAWGPTLDAERAAQS
ncbi:MAG: NAD(P)-dependent oxidoreductase, partial [Candidatus Latescibacteria bacterium]|nr:NAD(P)-dependent oxidoreductase [Candidatus Latescibacterota bacterium]